MRKGRKQPQPNDGEKGNRESKREETGANLAQVREHFLKQDKNARRNKMMQEKKGGGARGRRGVPGGKQNKSKKKHCG